MPFNWGFFGSDQGTLGSLAPSDFVVEPGMEGPQIVCRWTPTSVPIEEIIIRRREDEFPIDETDGIEIISDSFTQQTRVLASDASTGLLEDPAADPGEEVKWWYVRMFVKPAPPAAFGEDGIQLVDDGDDSNSIVITEFTGMTIDIDNLGGVNLTAQAQESVDNIVWFNVGPATVVAGGGSGSIVLAGLANNWLRVGITGADSRLTFTPTPLTLPYLSADDLSGFVLVYKTGRNATLMFENIAAFYEQHDQLQDSQVILNQTTSSDNSIEISQIGFSNERKGPLSRMFTVLGLELDRQHAYRKAMQAYSDIAQAPDYVLNAIGYEQHTSTTSLTLRARRAELFRIASIYKRKGSMETMLQIANQVLGYTPIVVEGRERMLLFANPEQFP